MADDPTGEPDAQLRFLADVLWRLHHGALLHALGCIQIDACKSGLTWLNRSVYKAGAPRELLGTPERMQVKKVYVNDVLIGQASTWTEVHGLLGLQGVHFIGKPGAAEGPTAFYLSGAVSRSQERRARSADETA